MKIREIQYSSHFAKAWKAISRKHQRLIEERERIFRENPFDPRLKTHKLKGKLRDYWSFSITYSLRIVFKFVNKNKVLFYDIGDHSIYK